MPKPLRLVLLATGDLAIPALEALHESDHELRRVLALSQRKDEELVLPEERQGGALAARARKLGIEVRRPGNPASEEVRQKLEALEPDLGLMVAYGRQLPPSLLEVPKRGWLKLHFALLPKNRGLHPIRAALWEGMTKTGVSVIQVTEDADQGPIVMQETIDIEPEETFGGLAPRLAELAAQVAPAAVDAAARKKKLSGRTQNDRAATKTPRFSRRHCKAPWWLESKEVFNHLRALSPEPGMTTLIKMSSVRILSGGPMDWVQAPFGEAGSYIGVRSGRMAVLCGSSTVFGIEHLQLPGEDTPISASKFARAEGLQVGSRFV